MPVQAGSGAYFLFVAFVFFLYWANSQSRLWRLSVILLADYLFCARYGLFYVVLIPACASLDYVVGLGLMRENRQPLRRALVAFSVTLNLTLLAGSRHMGSILLAASWDWIFPLGLSFYVFQALTYTIDLYRRDSEGTSSLLAHLSSVAFFPTLQAGPITRVADLIQQFTKRPTLSREDGGRAFFLIGMGLLKKALIADYLAENLVNRVFDTPNLYSGAEALIAVYAYSLQLYYDFSGYTDIARGSAMLLGIRLPVNFDRPYLASNLTDFWRRWHISFSNWLRDYLYFSLPGKRTRFMPYVGLILTMLLGGLWHGFAWTFAIWGLLHGTMLAAIRAWWAWRGRPKQPASPLRRAAAVFGTYQFVCLTWIFFRAANVRDAFAMLSRIGSLTIGLENITLPFTAVLLCSAALLFVKKQWYTAAMDAFALRPFYVHAAALLMVAAAIQLLGGQASAPFVYSRF
ncbi:Membrane bound O-acyl transferase, MBOAT family protein [Candidatus Sulfopaludibacter sp. SbA3]|nr:Membrane bound O-acyl transferase, MBOAT family protein [Candidatus Sulfopaludibacter sp. SbA3]